MWPRLASRQRRGFIFWKNILAHQDADEFVSSFQQGQAGHAEQVARHVYDLAQVANGKYFWIAWSIRAAVFGGVLAVLSLLLKEALP
ncbi:MAG: DUF5706 domain-containing protein [Planctomycetota bacterium]|nr:DUF5706 domain-containing protein [Planctomycetota bacterium]